MYTTYERCEPLLKQYLALILVPLLFTGCGKSLEYVSIDDGDTTQQSDTDTTLVTELTSVTDPTVSDTTITLDTDTTYEYVETDSTDLDVNDSTTATTNVSQTTIPYNDKTIVLSDVTIATTVTTVTTLPTDTTTEATTTTHILSSYGDDEQLITLATSLYRVACEMYWNYYYDSPYSIDYDQETTDDQGNTFFAISDPSISSLEDVRNDWYTVFSTTTDPQDFNGHFLERDSKVYINDGARGSDIYYSDTEITGIVSSNDDQVTFTAVSHYVDPNDGSILPDVTDEFSIILEDGSYHVGKFTLPY